MSLDAITLEVLRHRLDAIANNMESTLIKSAYSSIVKEGGDCSVALFDVGGETIAQGVAIPVHLGSMPPAIKSMLAEFPPDTLREGDMVIMNDPYGGGQHNPDVVVLVPVVHRGETVAIAASLAHHQDVGGRTPGSNPTDATDVFEEGLCIPPLKFVEGGRMSEVLEALIRRNVRRPEPLLRRSQCPDGLRPGRRRRAGLAVRQVRPRGDAGGDRRASQPVGGADPRDHRKDPRGDVSVHGLARQRRPRSGPSDQHHGRGHRQGVRHPRRLCRHQPPGPRSLQRRPLLCALFGALRGARDHRSRDPQQRRLLPGRAPDHPGEVPAQPAASGRRQLPLGRPAACGRRGDGSPGPGHSEAGSRRRPTVIP